jgi:hypothetical protein
MRTLRFVEIISLPCPVLSGSWLVGRCEANDFEDMVKSAMVSISLYPLQYSRHWAYRQVDASFDRCSGLTD